MPELEALFRPAGSAFRGADANYSVPLGPHRLLWLFGDTWVVPPEAEGRKGAGMIRNSLAIQEIGGALPASPEFFWRTDEKSKLPGRAADALAPISDSSWLWPLSGLRLGDHLCLFASQLISAKGGFGFAGAGNWLLVVNNPDDPPAKWRFTNHKIPFFTHSKTGDRTIGCASVAGIGADSNYVFIYGVHENWVRGMDGRGLIVARVAASELWRGDFDSWEFYSGSGWEKKVDRAKELFLGAASEMSVSYLPGSDQFVAVYSEHGLSPKILARFSPRPEGPWSEPLQLYECPDAAWKKDYFCYAAKAHPELTANPNELIITYATNSMQLGDHVNDLRIYWPRFIQVKIGMKRDELRGEK